jgi:hypothetical protein
LGFPCDEESGLELFVHHTKPPFLNKLRYPEKNGRTAVLTETIEKIMVPWY